MINVSNLSKSYGSSDLLINASFKINKRERVGLVGRNGHGKTTLFRIISKEEEPSDGEIFYPRDYTIGYLKQELKFSKETAREEALTSLKEEDSDITWKGDKILSGLGFTELEMNRHPSELSGGFQIRLNLAKLLLSEPNMLLLDEPNNYLDITSIRWLENFLKNWKGELFLITHDRTFMDSVATHTMGIHRKKLKKIPGGTEKFYTQVAQEEEIYEKTRVNDEKKRKEIENFVTRFRAKANLATRVQSRIKKLDKWEKTEKLVNIASLGFAFTEKPFHSKVSMTVKDISFGYDEALPLIKNFSASIGARDRICVVGPNGKGKTTLLKLLSKTLDPTNGEVSYHPETALGYYEQTNVKNLVDSKTVLEELLCSTSHYEEQKARNIAGKMMFPGDDALKKIKVLSGGEKSRVMIGKLLLAPHTLLLLDEPTNHLDMDSTDTLLAAIDNFDGAVIMVTHNEMFLHALAQKLIVFQGDKVTFFNGDYQRFLDNVGWDTEDQPKAKTQEASSNLSKKELRKKKSDLRKKFSSSLKPLEEKITHLEVTIEVKEEKLADLNSEMLTASENQDSAKISMISKEIKDCQNAINVLFDDLEKVTDQYEANKSKFEEEIESI